MYNNDDAAHGPGSQRIHKLLDQPNGTEAEIVLNDAKSVRQYACQNFRDGWKYPTEMSAAI